MVSLMIFPKRNVIHLDGVAEILSLMNENGGMRFSGIMRKLNGEKNPPLKNAAALSYRLRALEMSGLIKKDIKNKTGKQVKIFYQLTDEGNEALVHLKKLNAIIHKASLKVEE